MSSEIDLLRRRQREYEGLHVGWIKPERFRLLTHPTDPDVGHWDKLAEWRDAANTYGPQSYKDEDYHALKRDIAKRGVQKPVLVSFHTGAVKDGHHRAYAAMELGQHVPVIDYDTYGWPKGYE
jgi:hypothetical protein